MSGCYGSATADKRIQPYLEHLERGGRGVPYVGRSHETLRMIQAQYGVAVVDSLLREHWDAVRTAGPVHLG